MQPALLTDAELESLERVIISPKQRRVLAYLAQNPKCTTMNITQRCEVISFPSLKNCLGKNLAGFNLKIDGTWVIRVNSFNEPLRIKLWSLFRT